MSDTANDFDIANAINELIKNIEKDRQQRILRWVAENLGIVPPDRIATKPEAHKGGTSADLTFQSTPSTSDIKSFVIRKSPKSDIHFAAVVAYYYRFEAPIDDRRDTITSEILQNATRLVGRDRLKNSSFTLNNAKKQGYLDAAERGEYKINTVGENLVAMTLPGASNSAKSKSKIPAKRKSAKAAI